MLLCLIKTTRYKRVQSQENKKSHELANNSIEVCEESCFLFNGKQTNLLAHHRQIIACLKNKHNSHFERILNRI